MKKLISIVFATFILLCLSLSVNAAQAVTDNADLFSPDEETELTSAAAAIYDKYGFDVAVATVTSTDGKSERDFADDFYDYQGHGDDGALLLIVVGKNRYYISTSGKAIALIDDATLDDIKSDITKPLSQKKYYEAAQLFYNDFEFEIKTTHAIKYGIVFLAAAIISIIVVLIMKNGMNTVIKKPDAGTYERAGSFNITNASERFMYSTITKTKKPENTSGSGGVHTSGSGRSHGGGGGSF